MSREARVRFWERVGVRLPCATRQVVTDTRWACWSARMVPVAGLGARGCIAAAALTSGNFGVENRSTT